VVDGNQANAWNINRIEYTDTTSIVNQDTDITEVFFRADGTSMYIVGNTTDRIYQYTLSIPWDITTASNVSTANIAPQDTNVQGLYIKDDGTRMFTVGVSNDAVYEYRLATPWMVNTASIITSKSIVSEEASARAIEFSKDGVNMYIVGTLSDTVYQYTLTTPWQVDTASYSGKSLSVVSRDNFPTALRFKSDGTKLYVIGQQNDSLLEYSMTTAYDISTATFTNSIILSATTPTGLYFKYDGTAMYVCDSTADSVQQYNFNTSGITPIDSNVYITSGNIIYYNKCSLYCN